MVDEGNKIGGSTLLKGATAALVVSHLAGQMAKGIEEAEKANAKIREADNKRQRYQADIGPVQPMLNVAGDPIILSNGKVMWQYASPMPPARPGRFMDPRLPGIGYIPPGSPLWRSRTREQVIADREKEWYMANGYVQQNSRWMYIGRREAACINNVKEKDWYIAHGYAWRTTGAEPRWARAHRQLHKEQLSLGRKKTKRRWWHFFC